MVTMPQVADRLQDVLQLRDFSNPRATEEVVGNGVLGEASFAKIEAQFASIGQHATEGKRGGGNAAFVAAIAASFTNGIGQDRMV